MTIIDPANVIPQIATGTGDMGAVATKTSVARFSLDVDRFVPIYIRARFTGGSGSAAMTMRIDHRSGNTDFDFVLYKSISNVGTGGKDNLNIRFMPEELAHFVLYREDILVLEWANPDAGNMTWAVELGLADAANIIR